MLFDSQHHEFPSLGRCWHRRKLWKSFHANKSRTALQGCGLSSSIAFLFIVARASPLNFPFVMARSMTGRSGNGANKTKSASRHHSQICNVKHAIPIPVYDHIQRVNYCGTQRTTCFHLTSKDFAIKFMSWVKSTSFSRDFYFSFTRVSTHSSLPSLYMLFYLSSFHKFFIVLLCTPGMSETVGRSWWDDAWHVKDAGA